MSTERTPENIKRLREISARFAELGCPVESLNKWIDEEEAKPRPPVEQNIGDRSIKHFRSGPDLSHDKPMIGHFGS